VTDVARNLARIQERIAEAALRVGRKPAEVTVVAVAKTFPAEAVIAAYQAGVLNFGENRVEEGMTKIPAVHAAISGPVQPGIWWATCRAGKHRQSWRTLTMSIPWIGSRSPGG